MEYLNDVGEIEDVSCADMYLICHFGERDANEVCLFLFIVLLTLLSVDYELF